MMIEISNRLQKNTFYMAMIGYGGTFIIIFFYYFNLNSLLFEIFSGIISFMLLPIFGIMILSRNPEASKVTREKLEKMDIDTYLKPFSNVSSDKPSWLMFGLSLTLLYSFVSFFYWMAHSSNGVPVIEHGEYFVRNHEIVKAITEEKFNELKRLENIGMASHYLAFYAISIWMLYKKEYIK